VVVAAANTVASLFYYLRWIAPAFRTTEEPGPERPRPFAPAAAVLAAACVLALGAGLGAVAPTVQGTLVR
jgi:NADH-quinone oxidoreductase subunit N